MFIGPEAPIFGFLVLVLGWALAVAVLYWVVRLAVRHAIADADLRRQQSRDEPRSLPRDPAGRSQGPSGS